MSHVFGPGFSVLPSWYPRRPLHDITPMVRVNLPKGFGYVEFKNRADVEKAQKYMDGAQIDGKVVWTKFTLPERKKLPSPPKIIPSTSKVDAPNIEGGDGSDADKDDLKNMYFLTLHTQPSFHRSSSNPCLTRVELTSIYII